LCDGDIANFTIPPTRIATEGGVKEVVFVSAVVTVGTTPGGQVTARTPGAPASPVDEASGEPEPESELPHAARQIDRTSETRVSIGYSS
jgi:hypothetical protein